MASEIDLIPRLLAYEAGRAQRQASHLHLSVRRDALVVCPIALAGEDTTVHIMAIGPVGRSPRILCVPDPRIRDDQYALFEAFGAEIERYFQDCRDAETHPQLWVPSGSAVALLDVLADRLRYNRDNPRVKRAGELLSYATERYPTAGQQALLSATGALKRHWATGQQQAEDEHLGTLLAWIEPPAGATRAQVLAAVTAAEQVPMGVKTDPEFDRDTLMPLVSTYNEARRAGAATSVLARRAAAIQAALEPAVRRIYAATQRAIGLLLAAGLPPLPDLAALERLEAAGFASFMESRDQGYGLPLRDKPKPAAFKLNAREDAAQNVAVAVLRGDRVARARGTLAGRVVVGAVSGVRAARIGRKTEHRLTLASSQRVLHVRQRDTLSWVEDPRLQFVVEDVRRAGRTTQLLLAVAAGMRAVGVPENGSLLELATGAPDWSRLGRLRVHLAERLRNTPWTHAQGDIPASPARRGAPADPLAALEALR